MDNPLPHVDQDRDDTGRTARRHAAADHQLQHHHHGNTDPPEGHPSEHVQEHLGAAATHDHQAAAHAEHTGPEDHRHSHGAHTGGHAGHGEAMFQRPFWVSLVLTIPILFYAEHIQTLLGYAAPPFPGSRWLEPVLASVIYWYGG